MTYHDEQKIRGAVVEDIGSDDCLYLRCTDGTRRWYLNGAVGDCGEVPLAGDPVA